MRSRIAEAKDIAKLDIYRDNKCGIPEAILGPEKNLFKESVTFFCSLIELASDFANENPEKTCLNGPEQDLKKAHSQEPLIVVNSPDSLSFYY